LGEGIEIKIRGCFGGKTMFGLAGIFIGVGDFIYILLPLLWQFFLISSGVAIYGVVLPKILSSALPTKFST